MIRKIAAVIPARNEARTISTIVRDVIKLGLIAIVVDDGSADDTAHQAKLFGAVVVRHVTSQGYTKAILAGIAEANSHLAEHIVTIDGDGAHDPQDLPLLLSSHIQGSFSLTVGNRLFSTGLAANSTKLLVNRLAWPILKRATRIHLPNGDYASGLRVYSHSFAQHILNGNYDLHPFGLCFYSIFDAIRSGFSVSFYPCTVRYNGAQLLYTKRGEFLDFLSTAIDLAVDARFLTDCLEFRDAVSNMKPLRFILDDHTIYAIPLNCEDGYIFQQQCKFYDELNCGADVATLALSST